MDPPHGLLATSWVTGMEGKRGRGEEGKRGIGEERGKNNKKNKNNKNNQKNNHPKINLLINSALN